MVETTSALAVKTTKYVIYNPAPFILPGSTSSFLALDLFWGAEGLFFSVLSAQLVSRTLAPRLCACQEPFALRAAFIKLSLPPVGKGYLWQCQLCSFANAVIPWEALGSAFDKVAPKGSSGSWEGGKEMGIFLSPCIHPEL